MVIFASNWSSLISARIIQIVSNNIYNHEYSIQCVCVEMVVLNFCIFVFPQVGKRRSSHLFSRGFLRMLERWRSSFPVRLPKTLSTGRTPRRPPGRRKGCWNYFLTSGQVPPCKRSHISAPSHCSSFNCRDFHKRSGLFCPMSMFDSHLSWQLRWRIRKFCASIDFRRLSQLRRRKALRPTDTHTASKLLAPPLKGLPTLYWCTSLRSKAIA